MLGDDMPLTRSTDYAHPALDYEFFPLKLISEAAVHAWDRKPARGILLLGERPQLW